MYDLITRERKKLVGYVKTLLRETGSMDAEDLVQDVVLRLLERRNSANSIENTSAYLYRSLRNRVIDYQRAQKPVQSADTPLSESGETLLDLLKDYRPDALELLQTEQGKIELFEALDRLSEIEKQVVIAHELEGTSFKHMTNAWSIPQNTLISHKSRAMQKLRKYFLDQEGV